MLILIYILTFLIGLVGAAVNTLPPSATNLAVVKYTSDKKLTDGLHLAYGAALGELVVAGLALAFGVLAKRVYQENTWIQIFFIVLLACAGVYFLLKKRKNDASDTSSMPQRFVNGFALGALNLPMFIYWTAIFALASDYVILNENSPWLLITVFLTGVYLGKFLILYLYGRLSDYMTENFENFKGKLDLIIGLVLVVASIGQTIKLLMA